MIAGFQQQNPESVFRRSPPADRTTDTNIIAQSFPFGKPFLCKKHGKVRKPYPKIHKNHENRLPCKISLQMQKCPAQHNAVRGIFKGMLKAIPPYAVWANCERYRSA
jgi:hypothetical protein